MIEKCQMQENEPIEKKSKGPQPPRGLPRRPKKNVKPYAFEIKLRAVKLYLEEGFSGRLISEETGVSQQVLSGWIRQYQEQGEEGDLTPKAGHFIRRVLPLV